MQSQRSSQRHKVFNTGFAHRLGGSAQSYGPFLSLASNFQSVQNSTCLNVPKFVYQNARSSIYQNVPNLTCLNGQSCQCQSVQSSIFHRCQASACPKNTRLDLTTRAAPDDLSVSGHRCHQHLRHRQRKRIFSTLISNPTLASLIASLGVLTMQLHLQSLRVDRLLLPLIYQQRRRVAGYTGSLT